MILEHALLVVREDVAEDFEAAMSDALGIITLAPGCHAAEVRRQIEDPRTYLLMVTWDSVAHHEAFRASGAYETWRVLTHPWYETTPAVTHFDEPLART